VNKEDSQMDKQKGIGRCCYTKTIKPEKLETKQEKKEPTKTLEVAPVLKRNIM
jgi:hypothetical protein